MKYRNLVYIAIVLLFVGPAVLFEYLTTPEAATKRVHLEMFRYGTHPSIIRANRGDEIIMTFQTNDTGHSFLLQDYHLEAKVFPASETVELRDPLDMTYHAEDVSDVRFIAGLKGFWARLVSVSRFRCHIYCGKMHGFEQGDLIVRPNWLFTGGLGFLAAIVTIACLRVRWEDVPTQVQLKPIDLNKRSRWLDAMIKWRPLQFVLTVPALVVFTLVIVAGFFGTKVGGRNFGVMLTWSVWMAVLTIFLTPLGSRLWCMICPLPVLGEYLQRAATIQVHPAKKKGRFGNSFLGLALRWPRFLRGPWLRMLIFLSLGTLSASLAGQPRWTATVLFALVVIAILTSMIWELRAFCRYICPVATFISLYSPVGRVMVRSRDLQTCKRCKEKACIRGNEKGWACPYGLYVGNIKRNYDCGFCSECFKSCPHDNVSLAYRRGSWTERFASYGEAWQAIVMLVLGMVYPLTILSPWPAMRDTVNVVDKSTWAQFARYAASLWVVSLALVPLIFWLATKLGAKLACSTASDNADSMHRRLKFVPTGEIFKRTISAVIPLGLCFWVTFFIATLMVNFTYVLLAISDPFGHGWDLLGIAGLPWIQIWPAAIPWIQAILVATGLIFSLKKGYKAWYDQTRSKDAAFRGFTPTATILIMLAAVMLTYFTNF